MWQVVCQLSFCHSEGYIGRAFVLPATNMVKILRGLLILCPFLPPKLAKFGSFILILGKSTIRLPNPFLF